jgi:hypothetical protein
MGCTNSKLNSEILTIKTQLQQQMQEQYTLQTEFLYLLNELKEIKQKLKHHEENQTILI